MKQYIKQKPPLPEEKRPPDVAALLRCTLSEEDSYAVADTLLSKTGSPLELLSLPPEELLAVPGVEERTAILLRVTAAMARRYWMQKYEAAISFQAPHTIIDYLTALYLDTNVEEVYLLSFDQKKRFLGCDLLSRGSFTSSSIDHRKLLRLVLEREAAFVLLSHNHPAGEPGGSRADYEANQKIENLLSSIGVSFYDHVVVSCTEYESLLGRDYP